MRGSSQRSFTYSIHHVSLLFLLDHRVKKYKKQLQPAIVPVRRKGSTKSWQPFKFKAQHAEHYFAWDPAEKPSRRKTVR